MMAYSVCAPLRSIARPLAIPFRGAPAAAAVEGPPVVPRARVCSTEPTAAVRRARSGGTRARSPNVMPEQRNTTDVTGPFSTSTGRKRRRQTNRTLIGRRLTNPNAAAAVRRALAKSFPRSSLETFTITAVV